MGTQRWRTILEIAATIVMLIAGLVVIATVLAKPRAETGVRVQTHPPELPPLRDKGPLPVSPMSLDGIALKGSRTASVGMIEYSDFECPYCSRFALETLPRIVESFVDTGRVLFGFHHLPIETKHANAVKAAEAAECAGEQGRFWELHDALFAMPLQLDESSLLKKARGVGVEVGGFGQCLNGRMTAKVRADMSAARVLSVSATPTFFFGWIDPEGRLQVTRRESGALPYEVFAGILNELLAPEERVSVRR